jgi:hypothetical protein
MLEDGLFPVEDIDILFQDFKPQVYPQVGNEKCFSPCLSILDILMNAGPVRTMEMIVNGTVTWHSWDDMVSERTRGINYSEENLSLERGMDG